MSIGVGILLGIFVLGILAVSHELGHFLATRLSHIPVEEFGYGIGPVIYQHKAKDGMVFKLSAIPFLGYVKIKGMDNNIDAPDGFFNQPFWPKLFTMVAGPLMNILVAILLFSIVFSTFGNPAVPSNVVATVLKDSPAYTAGMLPNDKIIEINGVKISEWSQVNNLIQESKGDPLEIVVDRNNREVHLVVTPSYDNSLNKWLIGVSSKGEVYSFPTSFIKAGSFTFKMLGSMFASIAILFTKEGATSVTGPIGIVSLMAQSASGGFLEFLFFSAYISLALGFTNLLPIPALDGSWILVLLIEGITRKKIVNRTALQIQSFALFILLALMVLVSINDIIRIIAR